MTPGGGKKRGAGGGDGWRLKSGRWEVGARRAGGAEKCVAPEGRPWPAIPSVTKVRAPVPVEFRSIPLPSAAFPLVATGGHRPAF